MKKILLIEDDAYIRSLYEDVLRHAGFEITAAVDGEDALSKASSVTGFDLVLLDIMLPKLTGMEVLKAFREDSSPMKNTPIYLLTNLGEDTVAKEAYKMGADGYLLKAKYLPKELIAEVNKFFVKNAGTSGIKDLYKSTAPEEVSS